MFAEQRSKKIISLLKSENKVYVNNLAKLFDVSKVTIRKDLTRLVSEGVAIKTHGGAILNDTSSFTTISPDLISKNDLYSSMLFDMKTSNQSIKDHLALSTYKRITHGDTIYLGSGYTCTSLARLIKKEDDLCIITNNLEASFILRGKCRNLILLGGEVVQFSDYTFTASNQIETYLNSYNINVAITSSSSISKDFGISFSTEVNLKVMKAVREAANEWYLMVDHSKFNRVSPYKISNVEDASIIFTDRIFDDYKNYSNIILV